VKVLNPYRTIYTVILILLTSGVAFSQDIKDIFLNESFVNQPLEDFIITLKNKYNVDVYYDELWVKPYKITQTFINTRLEHALNVIFQQHDLTFDFFQDDAIVIYNRRRVLWKQINTDNLITTIGDPINIGRYSKAILKGKILDGKTGETLVGAKIYCSQLEKGTTADNNGKFEIELPTGKHQLQFSYIGFTNNTVNIHLVENGYYEFQIFEKIQTIGEIKIFGLESTSRAQMSMIKMTASDLKLIPAFMGEADIFKSMTMQPGVQTVGELSSGFNVRGGNTDQNLILINGSPIFNSSHLFGFFSLINPDVVEQVSLYKGGMPAKLGERVSSVMEVQFKDGNDEKILVYGGIGLINSRLTLEGPLGKNKKLTFIAGGRSSYTNWILKKLPELDLSRSVAEFYDISGKLSYKFNQYNKLSFMAYHSSDEFSTSKQSVTDYENTLGNVSLKTRYTESLFANLELSYSKYAYQFTDFANQKPHESYYLDNSIQYGSVAYHLNWQITQGHNLEAGFKAIYNQINPGEISPLMEKSIIKYNKLHDEKSFEWAAYFGDKFDIVDEFSISAGLRYSQFQNTGTRLVYVYDPDKPKSPNSVIDSIQFSSNESSASYGGFEPRLSAIYDLDPNTSLKISYQRTRQNIFQLSNSAVISPAETWKSADFHLPPLIADQLALGVAINSWIKGINLTAEVYYKQLQNLIEYKNGARLIMNEKIETDLIPTNGYSYGVEFSLKKTTGRLTGFTSYVFSRTKQRNRSAFNVENLWEGKYYPSIYDKPHDFSLTGTYKISRRWRFSGNFIYISGRPLALPELKYRYKNKYWCITQKETSTECHLITGSIYR
jgi:hypothetical protein